MRQWILSTVCGLLAGVAFSFPAHVSTGSLDIASAGSASWNAFSFKWNNRDVQQFSVTFTNSLSDGTFADVTNVQFRLSYPEAGPFYLTIINGTLVKTATSIVYTLPTVLPTTNIPPPQRYYAEFLAYDANQSTRTLAKGTVETEWSLFYNTNTAAWLPVSITFAYTTNNSEIVALRSSITTNATGIASNLAAIGSNDTDIAVNAGGITTNATGVASNLAAIGSNDTDIAANAGGISTNATGVASNLAAIGSNDTDIAVNAGGISTNAADLTTHTTNTANPHAVTAAQAGAVATNDAPYLAALTNATITGGTSLVVSVTGRILGITVRTNFVENNTGNWDGTWQGLGTNAFQPAGSYATGTPLYVESYVGTVVGATVAEGTVNSVTTNAGVLGFITRTNYASAAQGVLADAAYPASNPSNFIMEVGTVSHTNLTDVNGAADVQHLTAAEKAHAAAAITNETDPVWESEKSGYATGTPVYVESDPVWVADKAGYYTQVESDGLYATGTPIYVESDPVWESEKSGYATGTPLYVYSETDPVWEAEKADYATGTPLYVESYVGTIVGGTIVTGAAASVTTNAGILDFVVPSGGGGAGTFTNMLSTDGSIDWTNPEGPQPDGSVTGYVQDELVDYVATNAADYTGLLTNLLAFHGESNLYLRVDGTNIYYGESVTIAAGTTAGTYYDGANGASVSGQVAIIKTNYFPLQSGINVSNRVAVLEVPYQTYSATVSPDAGGTCTIAYANGSLVKIDVSTNITIFFDNAAYPTNGVNRVGVEVWAATNTVGFVDSNVTNVSELVFTNKYPASLFFRKTGTNNIWWGRD